MVLYSLILFQMAGPVELNASCPYVRMLVSASRLDVFFSAARRTAAFAARYLGQSLNPEPWSPQQLAHFFWSFAGQASNLCEPAQAGHMSFGL